MKYITSLLLIFVLISCGGGSSSEPSAAEPSSETGPALFDISKFDDGSTFQ